MPLALMSSDQPSKVAFVSGHRQRSERQMAESWKQPRIGLVCASRHHGNTLRIADAMGAALNAEIMTTDAALHSGLDRFDLVGFGSGIYFGRHDRRLLRLVETLTVLPKAVLIFSTAGLPWLSPASHWPLRRRLKRCGCRILGEFSCAGYDTVGPLAWIGGLNRGRPDAGDCNRSRQFAAEVLRKISPQECPVLSPSGADR